MLAAERAALAAVGEGWIVGGAARDAQMGRPVCDIDLAVPGDASSAAARLASATGAARILLSNAFGAWRLSGGRLPAQVDITPLQGATLSDDLARRDFTVNAMAIDLADGTLIDPHAGRADLAAGVLRPVGPTSLEDDPVRVLRAARFGEQLALTPDDECVTAARAAAAQLWDRPGERLRGELLAIVALPGADRALALLDHLGGLGVLVPELEDARGMGQNPFHHKDVLGHTLEVVTNGCALARDPAPVFRGYADAIVEALQVPIADGVTHREVLVLACLLHDMAKPATREVQEDGRVTFFHHDRRGADAAADLLQRLRCARALQEAVAACVREHLRIGFLIHRQPLSLRQIDRALRALRPVVAESFVLSAADRMATRGVAHRDAQMARHLRLIYDLAEQWQRFAQAGDVGPVVTGDVVAAHLGRTPGPWLGRLLEALREEHLMRPGMTATAALRFAERWVAAQEDPR